MKKSLTKVVERIIVPKYPWIKEFEWFGEEIGFIEYWTLYITIERKLPSDYDFAPLARDLNTLFKSVKHDELSEFGGVKIIVDGNGEYIN